MTCKIAYVTSRDVLQFRLNGSDVIIPSNHPNYDAILNALDEGTIDAVPPLLVTVKQAIADSSDGSITLNPDDDELYFEGEPLHGAIARRIKQLLREGHEVRPLVNFQRNILDNPSARAREELFAFLEINNLPITPDGYFIAYKMVRSDFLDIYTCTLDNSPGKTVKMLRVNVDPDKDRTCSHGLHFASLEYVRRGGFGSASSGHRLVAVKINPRDVVAIPTDYNNSKGRTCQYLVIKELDWTTALPIDTVGFKKFDDASVNAPVAISVPANDHGTSADGVKVNPGNFQRKWTASQVANAKNLLADPAKLALGEISRQTGMSRRLLARIRDGQAYT